jgi:CDP-diacylglycerol--glycerol-3-phosphate 3-phosphatidyltransferase
MTMNVPNLLTLGRIILAPAFLGLFMYHLNDPQAWLAWLLVGIFALGEITDLLDGVLARKLHQISELGKLLDPFADVVSRLTYFLVLLLADVLPFWFFSIILYRELGITFWRLYLVQHHVVLGANMGGKTKAWLYFVVSLLGLASWLGRPWGWGWEWEGLINWFWNGFLIAVLAVSVGTFVNYLFSGFRRLKNQTADKIF